MQTEYISPVGVLAITAENGCITELVFGSEVAKKLSDAQKAAENTSENAEVLKKCTAELDLYFAGKLREFTVPVDVSRAKGSTEFRRNVWAQLLGISYGETISYKELAQRINNPAAIRAVGGANHHNPISIIIPCHRVIGADGGLTGYGGGIENKALLLKLEGNPAGGNSTA